MMHKERAKWMEFITVYILSCSTSSIHQIIIIPLTNKQPCQVKRRWRKGCNYSSAADLANYECIIITGSPSTNAYFRFRQKASNKHGLLLNSPTHEIYMCARDLCIHAINRQSCGPALINLSHQNSFSPRFPTHFNRPYFLPSFFLVSSATLQRSWPGEGFP
jgi:hypothetical protein